MINTKLRPMVRILELGILVKAAFRYSNFISRRPAKDEPCRSLRFFIRPFISISYKNRFIIFVAVLIFCFLASEAPGAAVLGVEGMLVELAEYDDGWFITLKVDGDLVSGPVAEKCKYFFYDLEADFEVDKEDFIERGVGQRVIVELAGRGDEVTLCRAIIIALD